MLARGIWLFAVALCLIIEQLNGHAIRRRANHKTEMSSNRMALWIDKQQIHRFAGIPIDIYILRNGAVMSYIQDVGFESQLPVLPSEVDYIELKWLANEQYSYKFTDLKSLDPLILYDPLISIPTSGLVPNKITAFQLAMPCTRHVTSIATMYIVLHIFNARGQPVPGSPLKFHLRKRCVASDSRVMCKQSCINGGKCNEFGQCVCRQGYFGNKCEHIGCGSRCLNGGTCVMGRCTCQTGFYGDHCQQSTGNCSVPCINGGLCSSDGICACPDGYVGQFCQKPLCRRWCGVHGRCVDVNQCQCHRGWRGKLCNKTVRHLYRDTETDLEPTRRDAPKLRNNMSFRTPGVKKSTNHIARRHRRTDV